MNHDPNGIARRLVEDYGLDEARQLVLGAVLEAQDAGDNYRLSVWREVRRFLSEYQTAPEAGGFHEEETPEF